MLPGKKWNIQDWGDKMLKIQDFPKQGDANSLFASVAPSPTPSPSTHTPSPPQKSNKSSLLYLFYVTNGRKLKHLREHLRSRCAVVTKIMPCFEKAPE